MISTEYSCTTEYWGGILNIIWGTYVLVGTEANRCTNATRSFCERLAVDRIRIRTNCDLKPRTTISTYVRGFRRIATWCLVWEFLHTWEDFKRSLPKIPYRPTLESVNGTSLQGIYSNYLNLEFLHTCTVPDIKFWRVKHAFSTLNKNDAVKQCST